MDNNELGTNLAEVGTDCISRQQAIEALERAKQNIHHNIERAIGDAVCEVLDAVENGIKQLPPIQPEIVRCRECKFASGDSRICMKFGHSPIGELDFCSFAERKEVTT